MRGYFIYQDCAAVTGNYTPNTTTDCVQSGLSNKDERTQPQFWEHLKMAFTLNMIVFKIVSLDNAQIIVSILIRKIFKNIILPENANYSSNYFTSIGLMKKLKTPALEDLFFAHSLLAC